MEESKKSMEENGQEQEMDKYVREIEEKDQEAYHSYLQGNIQKALSIMKSISNNNDDSVTTDNNLGMIIQNNVGCCHFALGKPTIAALNFQKASEQSNLTEHPNQSSSLPNHCQRLNKKYEIMYNFGVSLLHAKHTQEAFSSLVRCRLAFPSNPRLWLRIAECCVQLYKSSNEDEFTWTEQKRNILRGVENHVPLLNSLSNDPINQEKPEPTLYFGLQCIEKSLSLINNVSVVESNRLEVEPSIPMIDPMEIAILRANIYALGAFISLTLGLYPYAIQFSNELIGIQNVPNIFTYLGKMYLSQALFKHGGADMNLETFSEKFIGNFKLNLTMPNDYKTSGNEEINGENGPPKQKVTPLGSLTASKISSEWVPRDDLTARATIVYNQAVAFTALNRLQEASDVIDNWNLRVSTTGHAIFADFIILHIYLSLKLGNIEKSTSLYRQYYHYRNS